MEKAATISTLTSRRPKWKYPQATTTPRILHLPRRPPRRRATPSKANARNLASQKDRKGKLESLFDQEREFKRGTLTISVASGGEGDDHCEEERREKVEERERSVVVVVEEEKWRFQAEMLRAECNLLRMEREIAVKKMERRSVQMERTLRSAVQTLLSGREKICNGMDARIVLEEEIRELAEKLEKLQRRSFVKDTQVRKCSNFQKQASFLHRRIKNFGDGESDEIYVKEIQEMAEASLSVETTSIVNDKIVQNSSCNMEMLGRKMEGLSKGSLLERMKDDYGSMRSTANSSASTSKQIYSDISSSSMTRRSQETKNQEEMACSRCSIAWRVVEQIQAETEQWSQMQGMLGQVREEMEELQASRDFWKDQALDSNYQIQSLLSSVQEWKLKALSSEAKSHELQAQVSVLHADLERLRKTKSKVTSRIENSPFFPQDSPNEMEKRVLVCRLKENRCINNDGCKQKQVFNDVTRRPHACCTNGVNADPKRSPLLEQ